VRGIGKPFFVDVDLQVIGMDAEGVAETDGYELAAANEQVDEGTADMEDLSYFPEIEQAGLHRGFQCVRQARVEGIAWSQKYCRTMRALYRTYVLMSRRSLSTAYHGLHTLCTACKARRTRGC
jgi:hypothetical protein